MDTAAGIAKCSESVYYVKETGGGFNSLRNKKLIETSKGAPIYRMVRTPRFSTARTSGYLIMHQS